MTVVAITGARSASAPTSPTAVELATIPPSIPGETIAAQTTGHVVRIVDGDTLDVTGSDQVVERVRLIGVDAPESDTCEGRQATTALEARSPVGTAVTLTASPGLDRDRYGRLLRFVEHHGADLGYELVAGGYAIARYDGRDGYLTHIREEAYRTIDDVTPPQPCQSPSPGSLPAN